MENKTLFFLCMTFDYIWWIMRDFRSNLRLIIFIFILKNFSFVLWPKVWLGTRKTFVLRKLKSDFILPASMVIFTFLFFINNSIFFCLCSGQLMYTSTNFTGSYNIWCREIIFEVGAIKPRSLPLFSLSNFN